MPVEVAQGILNLTASFEGIQRDIERQLRGVNTRRAGQSAGDDYSSGFGASAKKLTGLIGGAFAAVQIGSFAKDAVAQASDLAEVGTKMQVVFGDANAEVQKFAAGGAKQLGMSSLAAQNAAASFGVFGKSAGLAGKDQADFSTGMASLAVDMASFSNTTPEQAIEALSAGLRGESEPLLSYGVLLDDASLRQEALSMGLITTTKDALTPQQKVLASHALILKQTTDAQGDFARTSGGLANQQRILSAQWTDMKGKLGAVFLPAVTGIVSSLNDHLFPTLDSLGTKGKDAWAVLSTGEFTGGTSLGEEDSPLVSALFNARDAFFTVQGIVKEAWSILSGQGFTGGNGLEEDSPLVDLIFKLRDFGIGTFDKLKGIWDTLWSTAEGLWEPIKSIAGSLADAFAVVGGTGLSGWDLLLDAFQGIADVLKATLIPAFEWLAGFARDNPAVILTLVGALVAWKTVTLAIAIATQAWAVVQGILNAVMAANPISLIVIALVALAAAVVWAYNNVDWFREIVDKAWSFIKEATTALWENVLQPILGFIGDNIHVVGDAFTWLWGVIQFAWDVIQNVIKWAWDNVIKPVFDAINVAVQGVGGFFTWLWDTVSDVWTWITEKVTTAWNWVRDSVFAPLNTGIEGVGSFFSDLWTTVSDVWTWIQDKINTVWVWIRDNIFYPLDLAINTVSTFMSNLWTTVETVWGNISRFFEGIAAGITTAVANVKKGIEDVKALITGFGSTLGSEGADLGNGNSLNVNLGGPAGGVQDIGKFFGWWAQGGVIPGAVSPVDNVVIGARTGEAVMVPEFAQAVGGGPGVHALNRAAERGLLFPGFAAGGVVGSAFKDFGGLIGYDVYVKAMNKIAEMTGKKIDAAHQAEAGGAGVNLAEFSSSQDPSSFGWQRAAGIVPFTWMGHPVAGGVAGGTGGLWGALLTALVPQIPGGLNETMYGYENRNNVNNPGVPSFHSFGLAVDVNASSNPNGVSGYGRSGNGVIPSGAAHSLAARYGMLWGGDFTGTPDPMHFEIHLPPSAIGGAIAGTLGAGLTSAIVAGTGVERWRGTVLQALGLIGQPAAFADKTLMQMNSESSGNENAINLTDANARRGDPSIGLMQVIGATFRAMQKYSPIPLTNIREPLQNIVAGMLWEIRNTGTLANWTGHAYDTGGWLNPGGTAVNLGPRPEAILTPPQSDALLTHAKALEAGFSGRANVIINLDSSDPLQVAVAQMIRDGVAQGHSEFASTLTRQGAQGT